MSSRLLVLTASDVSRITASFDTSYLLAQSARIFYLISNHASVFTSDGGAKTPVIDQPYRTTLLTKHHKALFMPARVADIGTSMKVVSVPTDESSQKGGLPASTLVLDEDTGGVKAIVNARKLTALRTASGSLLSTTLILPPSRPPTHILAFGAGAQIVAHLFLHLSHYETLSTGLFTLVTRDPSSATIRSALDELSSSFPDLKQKSSIHLSNRESVKKAVQSADIIVTATSSKEPLFKGEWVKPRAHVILVGSYTPEMHEIDERLVRRARKIVVDSRDAALKEAGELISAGLTSGDLLELGQLVKPRNDEDGFEANAINVEEAKKGDVTIFKSVGVGAQDVIIAQEVVVKAGEMGVGTWINGYD